MRADERKALMFVEDDEDSGDERNRGRNHTMSIRSSTSSKGTSALGYSPVK